MRNRQDVEILRLHFDPGKNYWGRVISINASENPKEKYSRTQCTLEYISNKNQPCPFVIGPENTKNLNGMTHRQVFQRIGYPETWLNENAQDEIEFHLAIFTEDHLVGSAPGILQY